MRYRYVQNIIHKLLPVSLTITFYSSVGDMCMFPALHKGHWFGQLVWILRPFPIDLCSGLVKLLLGLFLRFAATLITADSERVFT